MAISPYYLTPELDQKKENAKQKIALALMQQGASAEPIQHWTQGLARLAQGGLGGYELYKEDAADKAREAASGAAVGNLPGMGAPGGQIAPIAAQLNAPSAPSAAPSPAPSVPASPAGPASGSPAMRVASVFDTTKKAIDSGVIDPQGMANNLGAAPSPTAPPAPSMQAAPAPQVAQNTPTIQQQSIPADVAAKIRQLWASPATRPLAMQLYDQYSKPKEQYAPLTTPEERVRAGINPADTAGYQRDLASGKIVPTNTATNVSVNSVANPVLEGVGKQIVDARQKAETAVNTLPVLHEARRALDLGAITGATADWRVRFQKIGALFGADASKAENSEVFLNTVGREVLAHAKDLGPNPSNADRDYIKAVEAGDIKLEESSIRRLLDISEKASRRKIDWFNAQSKKLMSGPNAQETYKNIAPLMQFEQPPEYTPPAAAKPTTAPKIRRYNLKTGTIE